jgi:protein-L-isoaspartate(D-aspartate) O-methyltransferase
MAIATTNLNADTSDITRFNIPREAARFNMIEQQIRTWEVLDPIVLQLLHDVPREHFVPADYTGLAFADIEIPIGYGTNGEMQTMLSPKLEGRILQSLNLQKHQTVLHIGTGSGYFTALLASLAKHVVTVEISPDLSEVAANNVAQAHLSNVDFVVGDGAHGITPTLHTQTSFDAIVFTASTPVEPAEVRRQLNIGGLLFTIVGLAPVMQAKLIKRVSADGYQENVIFETSLPALINAKQALKFEF